MRGLVLVVVLLALAAAPLAGAEEEPRPSLLVEPLVRDVAPNATHEIRFAVHNPLAHPIALTLHAEAPTAKVRLDRAELVIPAGGRGVAVATVLVPDELGVSHFVTVGGDDARNGVSLRQKVELRAHAMAPPGHEVPPNIDVRVVPARVDLPQGGNATLLVSVRNGGSVPIVTQLEIRLPPGFEARAEPPLERILPGARMDIPVVVQSDGTRPVGDVAEGRVAPLGFGMLAAPFTVRTVAAATPVATEAPQTDVPLGAAAVVVGAAAGGIVLWATRREWWPLLLALYTRLRPSRMLDHPVRRRIVEIVQQRPGIAFGELARAADVAPGQLTHHARMLEKAGIVFSSPDGQTRRFFHVGAGRLAPVPPLSERALALLRERPRRASELARELGVSRQALHYHVKHLVAEGKLVARVDGRETWLEAPHAAQPSSGASRLARS